MGYLFSGLIALTLAGVVVALLALLKRLKATSPVEAELRSQVARLEGEAETLRGQLGEAERGRTQAETRLEAERKSLAEQQRLLADAEARLKDVFKALSADALRDSREQFLSTASERLRPIQDLLAEYQKRLQEIERARSDAYGGLKNHLDALAQAHQVLQKEAHQLSTALRSPTVRGRWGEMTLRRVVELAGMSPHCDFQEQVTATTEDGMLRPDMLIRLPGERVIVVDSKVPLVAYMDAAEAKDPAARQAALARHAGDVRKHVQALSRKAYWDQFEHAADFVVLFLPGESFFSAALEEDRSLMEDAMRSRVFLATPATLMALLNVVAHGWNQREMAENAARIAEAGKDLYDRIRVFAEKFRDVGSGLRSAAAAYDAAVGSYQSRLEPGARKLTELGASTGRDLPEVAPVEGPTRALGPADGPAG